ncbi:unnamed protein product [Cylicostephanus goldi]|uniref:Uncharacterized protein n=1 Tax=Cylicostephanus goldi TaxID=71465 RepID=A0A3P6U9Y7_CYLGO|nr:unnamed protein product [Cylicostephanus goldi]
MRALSASHLSQFELNSLAKQLWHLAPNSMRLTGLMTRQLENLSTSVLPWCSGETNCQGWTQAVETAIKVMENALPPPETLDPVVFNEQKANYRSLAYSAVSKPLSVLAEWRKRVSG